MVFPICSLLIIYNFQFSIFTFNLSTNNIITIIINYVTMDLNLAFVLLSMVIFKGKEALSFTGPVGNACTSIDLSLSYKHDNFHIRRLHHLCMIGTGFSFNDGVQILVSVQKPLGLVLEQDLTTNDSAGAIKVVGMDPDGSAARAGVQEGDVLIAVQNMSVDSKDLDEVLGFIGSAPRVVNLRLLRGDNLT